MEDVGSVWGVVVVCCSADVAAGLQWRPRTQPRQGRYKTMAVCNHSVVIYVG